MNARAWAVRLLGEHEAKDTYINLALSSPALADLSATERATLTALLYTAVERRLTLDYWISSLAGRSVAELRPHTRDLLRVALADLVFGQTPAYAAVSEAVKLARDPGECTFVNGVLRAATRQKENMPLPERGRNVARYLSVAYSFPLPLVRHFLSLYGERDTEAMLAAFDRVMPLSLTVNTRRTDRQTLISMLSAAGVDAAADEWTEDGILVRSPASPTALLGFAEGYFFVQDAACRVALSALGIRAGDTVVDVCAAPGGKSFYAAIAGGETTRVHAYDLHESKLTLVTSGAGRLGLSGQLTVAPRDARDPDPAFVGRADRVICDVPCSGLGVLGKKPDLRYKSPETFSALPPLQAEILSASASYVAPGGRLLYSTCTLNPAENEDIVRAFLDTHPDFSLCPLTAAPWLSADGTATLLPHRDGTDGFFFAVLCRGL